MKWLPGGWNDRRRREKWEAALAWFRLRYREPAGPTRCLKLLSRPAACGRIALYHVPGAAVSQLCLGLPASHTRLLQRMAGEFGLSLKPLPPEAIKPPIQRLAAVSELPWNRPFMAQLVGETLYASLADEAKSHGAFLPHPSLAPWPTDWQLPAVPPPGLTALPCWNGQGPPADLVAAVPDPQRWPVGRARSGTPLQVAGQMNIYGRPAAVADWLTRQVTQAMAIHPANLAVIDGAGDLVAQLKRKAAVTRLLGQQLTYVDLDSAPMAGGFNPLAAVPGETDEAWVQRWQRWFKGMDVQPQGLQWLAQAKQEGIETIPDLRKWLTKLERQGQIAAVSTLGLALNRLAASRALREWLEWPANRFDALPAGALFFACKNTGWDRRQLLAGVLFAALALPDVRLVVHGFPWKAVSAGLLRQHERLIVANGPLMPGSTTVLVASRPEQVDALLKRFLAGDAQLGENLALLGRGEGMVIAEGEVFFATWRDPGGRLPIR